MGDLSKDFSRKEFASSDGSGHDTVDAFLLEVLQDVRNHFAVPVTITSGHRSRELNSKVGGSINSQHLFGRAADFKVRGIPPAMVYKWLDETYGDTISLGLYDSWVHVDTRTDGGKRWVG